MNGLIGTGSSKGEGVFDFRYGPFAGGFAEAGVFHLHTYGEKILSVEVDLSYKHRGIEAWMAGRSVGECVNASEAVAGNFAFAHSLAFCRAVQRIPDETVTLATLQRNPHARTARCV